MPFVGQGVTGNPKRLFVAAKDRILFNTGDPQQDATMRAVKDSLTQVERALNTRAVSAKFINGATFSIPPGTTVATIGTQLWGQPTMLDLARNSITAIEAGIYLVTTNLFLSLASGTSAPTFIRQYNSAGALQATERFDYLGTSTGLNQAYTAVFAASYRDRFDVEITNSGVGTINGNNMNSFSATKITDVPSNFGV